MVNNISKFSNLNNINSFNPTQKFSTEKFPQTNNLIDFSQEDDAIISAEAKMLYELEKFNSGADNGVQLAISQVEAENITSAEVNVINTKKDMFETLMQINKD